ncbi:MAG: hypothetical protein ACP5NK_01935 [Thermoplasmata archaeon]
MNINYIFYFDFAVFSIFATLFITEIMGSVMILIGWDKYRRGVLDYIVPVWEVTGTFAAFWVVASDFAFPKILIPLADIFPWMIMLFLILFVARNSTIVFAEFILKRGWLDERKLYSGYALSTLLIALVVLIVVSGIIGGTGINLSTLSFSIGSWASSAGGWLFLIGAVIIALGLAPVFYNVTDMKRLAVPFTALGIIVSTLSFYILSPGSFSIMVVIPVVMTILVPLLFLIQPLSKIVTNKLFFIGWGSTDIFTMSFMVYPNAFGDRLPVDAFTTSGPLTGMYFIISLFGVIILGILVILYAYAVKRKSMAV